MKPRLFTFPNCHTCNEIKDYFSEQGMKKGIDYEELNLSDRENKKIFGEIYKNLEEPLKKDSKGIILPIFINFKDSKIEQIAQGEDIKTLNLNTGK